MVRTINFFAFLLWTASISAQTIIAETGFKIITESPIISLNTATTDMVSFYSDCGHCKYGHADFQYFQMDLINLKLEKAYREFAFGGRLNGYLPVSKYPAKNNSNFDVNKYKEVEFNLNGNIDTYNLFDNYNAFKTWSISGKKFVYLAKSKYFGSISLFTGSDENSSPFKMDVSFSNKYGFYWIPKFYSCDLNNKSFVSIKATSLGGYDDMDRVESAEAHYIYIIDDNLNRIEQKITIQDIKAGVGDFYFNVFYPLADTGDFVILCSNERYGQYDKSNKNYGIYIHYYSSNTLTNKGEYVKVWESKLSSDFTSVGAISAINGQVIVGGTSKNGGYLGYENPYLNVFDIKTGKFKKEYYIPFKAEGEGQTVYNIVPLQTSLGSSPDGESVKNGLYGGNNGDLLICCQPYKSSFEESGFGKGILIRDYLNSDGTFYNNLFNDQTTK